MQEALRGVPTTTRALTPPLHQYSPSGRWTVNRSTRRDPHHLYNAGQLLLPLSTQESLREASRPLPRPLHPLFIIFAHQDCHFANSCSYVTRRGNFTLFSIYYDYWEVHPPGQVITQARKARGTKRATPEAAHYPLHPFASVGTATRDSRNPCSVDNNSQIYFVTPLIQQEYLEYNQD